MKRTFMLMDGKLKWFFIISHITGWILANIQTIWIVWLMKKYHKELMIAVRTRR